VKRVAFTSSLITPGQQVHKVVKATGNAVCVDQVPLGVPIDTHLLFKYSIE